MADEIERSVNRMVENRLPRKIMHCSRSDREICAHRVKRLLQDRDLNG